MNKPIFRYDHQYGFWCMRVWITPGFGNLCDRTEVVFFPEGYRNILVK